MTCNAFDVAGCCSMNIRGNLPRRAGETAPRVLTVCNDSGWSEGGPASISLTAAATF